MDMQTTLFLGACLVGLVPLCWVLKDVYGYLRLVWLFFLLALSSPVVFLEIMRLDYEALRERAEPLADSILDDDGVYRALDWFSQPIEWIGCRIQNHWYLLCHRDIYHRWQRRKSYHRHRKRSGAFRE